MGYRGVPENGWKSKDRKGMWEGGTECEGERYHDQIYAPALVEPGI